MPGSLYPRGVSAVEPHDDRDGRALSDVLI
jgi:hypothetical protein